jgi:peptide/nickel transport system ATP-binding protein
MYAGQLVETASVEDALLAPAHPYTSGLLGSLPTSAQRKQELPTIPGRVPQLGQMPAGCRFRPRCPHAEDRCTEPQSLIPYGDGGGRLVRCCRADELDLAGALTKEAP